MLKRHPVFTIIGGGILAAWVTAWSFVSTVSTIDFMRTSGGHPGIGTFFLPRGLADGLTVVGIGVMVYAFIRMSRARQQSQPAQLTAAVPSAVAVPPARLEQKQTANTGDYATPLGVAVLQELWVGWSSLGDMYERLDYDNRSNTSTRLPFSSSSWPRFAESWGYVNVQLYKNAALVDMFKLHTERFLKAFGWSDYSIPRTEETVVMVDFIRDVRDFQAYLDGKIKPLRK